MSKDRPQSNPLPKPAGDAGNAAQASSPVKADAEEQIGSRWLRLCQGADQLEHAVMQFAEGGPKPDKAAISYLETVLEDFPQPQDPSRNVQAFGVHRLAYSIYEAVVSLGSR